MRVDAEFRLYKVSEWVWSPGWVQGTEMACVTSGNGGQEEETHGDARRAASLVSRVIRTSKWSCFLFHRL